jgi:hypothetical protein
MRATTLLSTIAHHGVSRFTYFGITIIHRIAPGIARHIARRITLGAQVMRLRSSARRRTVILRFSAET